MGKNAAIRARLEAEQQRREELKTEWEERVSRLYRLRATSPAELNDAEELELILSTFLYDDPAQMDDFIEDGIEAWNRDREILVTGLYRDELTVSNTYRKKFVELSRICRPHAFTDLKTLLPAFRAVFGSEPNAFEKMFEWHTVADLVNPDSSLDTEIASVVRAILQVYGIQNLRLNVRPGKYDRQDLSHRWGDFRFLLGLGHLESIHRRGGEMGGRSLEVQRFIKEALDFPELQDMPIEKYAGLLNTLSRLVVEQLLISDSYTIGGLRRVIGRVVGSDEEREVDDFLDFSILLLDWADRHRFQKDWLLKYACWFLDQQRQGVGGDMMVAPVPNLTGLSLYTDTFEFNFEEWLPGCESKEQYEARINEAFQACLYRFFQTNGRRLNLDRSQEGAVVGVTKPIDREYEPIRWLIAWNEGANYVQIAEAFDRSEKSIENAIIRLKRYDLPIRKGQRFKRSEQAVSEARLREIKELEV